MKTFFRIQTRGISLAEMQGHLSADGASEDDTHAGLCACDSVSALRDYISGWLVGDESAFEVVVLSGRRVGEVYDGLLIEPTAILERVPVGEFFANDRFYELESW